MKQIQRRYLYAGLLGALFFIVIYGILDLNILLSILLTLVIYLGGTFLYKGKDIRELNAENVDNYYFLASKCVNRANLCEDEAICSTVDKIATLTDEIIVSLSQRPKKVEQVFDFFDYYLDITNKILSKYLIIKKRPKRTTADDEFVKKTPEHLTIISSYFERQLSNMKEARMLDIENEIKIFENTVGLRKNDIEVGEENELK